MKFTVNKSGNAALAASDEVDFVENVGAAAVQTCQHFINGVSVGLQSNNAVDAARTSYARANTVRTCSR